MLFSSLLNRAEAVIMSIQRRHVCVCVCVDVSEFHNTCSIWPEAQSYLYSVGLLEVELLHIHTQGNDSHPLQCRRGRLIFTPSGQPLLNGNLHITRPPQLHLLHAYTHTHKHNNLIFFPVSSLPIGKEGTSWRVVMSITHL